MGTWAWYVARAGGIVSLGLLTAVVLLGLATRARWANDRFPRAYVTHLHRQLSLLSLVFLGVHIGTVILDSYVDVSPLDVVVPGASPYLTLPVALGAVAVDLLAAVVVTSLLQRRVGIRAWRRVHRLTYGVWALAVVHGIAAATDVAVVAGTSAVCGVAVAYVWWRADAAPRQRAAPVHAGR